MFVPFVTCITQVTYVEVVWKLLTDVQLYFDLQSLLPVHNISLMPHFILSQEQQQKRNRRDWAAHMSVFSLLKQEITATFLCIL